MWTGLVLSATVAAALFGKSLAFHHYNYSHRNCSSLGKATGSAWATGVGASGVDLDLFGSSAVCGESLFPAELVPARCVGGVNFHTANAYCTSVGARLCTEQEIKRDETRGTGCGFDAALVWTSSRGMCNMGEFMTVSGNTLFNADVQGGCMKSSANDGAVRCCADIEQHNSAAAYKEDEDSEREMRTSTETCEELGWTSHKSTDEIIDQTCVHVPRCDEKDVQIYSKGFRVTQKRATCDHCADVCPTTNGGTVAPVPLAQAVDACMAIGARICRIKDFANNAKFANDASDIARGGGGYVIAGSHDGSNACPNGYVRANRTQDTVHGSTAYVNMDYACLQDVTQPVVPLCCAETAFEVDPCQGVRVVKVFEDEIKVVSLGKEDYEPNHACNWLLQCEADTLVPHITPTKLDLEPFFDFLWMFEINEPTRFMKTVKLAEIKRFFVQKNSAWRALNIPDPLARLDQLSTGMSTLVANSSAALLRMTSDSNDERSGFTLNVTCKTRSTSTSASTPVQTKDDYCGMQLPANAAHSGQQALLFGTNTTTGVAACQGAKNCTCQLAKRWPAQQPPPGIFYGHATGTCSMYQPSQTILALDKAGHDFGAKIMVCSSVHMFGIVDAGSPSYFNARVIAAPSARLEIRHLAVAHQKSEQNAGWLLCTGCTATLYSVYAHDNRALAFGGVIFSTTGSSLTIDHSKFEGNEAQNFGGAVDSWGAVRVNNSTFAHNRAQWGGAMSCCSGQRGLIATQEVHNSLFANNSAVEDGGGAFSVLKGTLKLINCTVTGNKASGINGNGGGAIFQSGGSLSMSSTALTSDITGKGVGGEVAGMAVLLKSVKQWSVSNTSFTPFSEDTIYTVGSSSMSCDISWNHPCRAGQGCVMHNYSLSCHTCAAGKFSAAGISCATCPAGFVPNANRTRCTACPAGTTVRDTTAGICEKCEKGIAHAAMDRKEPATGVIFSVSTHCDTCEAPLKPNADGTKCLCPGGTGEETYFSLSGPGWTDASNHRKGRKNDQCVACPKNTFCPGGPVGQAPLLAKAGYWIDAHTYTKKLAAWHAQKGSDDIRPAPNVYTCESEDYCVGPNEAGKCDQPDSSAGGNGTAMVDSCCGPGSVPGSAFCAQCWANKKVSCAALPNRGILPDCDRNVTSTKTITMRYASGKGCVQCQGVDWLKIMYMKFLPRFGLGWWLYFNSKKLHNDNFVTILTTFFQFLTLYTSGRVDETQVKQVLTALQGIVTSQLGYGASSSKKSGVDGMEKVHMCIIYLTYQQKFLFELLTCGVMLLPILMSSGYHWMRTKQGGQKQLWIAKGERCPVFKTKEEAFERERRIDENPQNPLRSEIKSDLFEVDLSNGATKTWRLLRKQHKISYFAADFKLQAADTPDKSKSGYRELNSGENSLLNVKSTLEPVKRVASGQVILVNEVAYMGDQADVLMLKYNAGWVHAAHWAPFDKKEQKVVLHQSILKVAMFYYFPVTLMAMNTFFCRELKDSTAQYLISDLSQSCTYNGVGLQYWQYFAPNPLNPYSLIFTPSLIIFLSYGVAFPLVVWFLLYDVRVGRLTALHVHTKSARILKIGWGALECLQYVFLCGCLCGKGGRKPTGIAAVAKLGGALTSSPRILRGKTNSNSSVESDSGDQHPDWHKLETFDGRADSEAIEDFIAKFKSLVFPFPIDVDKVLAPAKAKAQSEAKKVQQAQAKTGPTASAQVARKELEVESKKIFSKMQEEPTLKSLVDTEKERHVRWLKRKVDAKIVDGLEHWHREHHHGEPMEIEDIFDWLEKTFSAGEEEMNIESMEQWSQQKLKEDPKAFMYMMVKPSCYWWMPWTLWRRVLMIFLYLSAQINEGAAGKIDLRFLTDTMDEYEQLALNITTAQQNNETAGYVDWLTLASIVLVFDLVVQQRVQPYINIAEGNSEILATSMLLVLNVIIMGVKHSYMLIVAIIPFLIWFLIDWLKNLYATKRAQAGMQASWATIRDAYLPQVCRMQVMFQKLQPKTLSWRDRMSCRCRISKSNAVPISHMLDVILATINENEGLNPKSDAALEEKKQAYSTMQRMWENSGHKHQSFEKYTKAFLLEFFDVDKDGKMRFTEFMALMEHEMGDPHSDTQLQLAFQKIRTRRKGRVTRMELTRSFFDHMPTVFDQKNRQHLVKIERLFKLADVQAEGSIDFADWQGVMRDDGYLEAAKQVGDMRQRLNAPVARKDQDTIGEMNRNKLEILDWFCKALHDHLDPEQTLKNIAGVEQVRLVERVSDMCIKVTSLVADMRHKCNDLDRVELLKTLEVLEKSVTYEIESCTPSSLRGARNAANL